METNFFSQITGLNIIGNLQLNISKGAENNLIVSVMLQNDGCGDDAKNLIPPYTLKATAEELDNAFFERITTPMQTASGLMDNMEAFMKQLDEARKKSAMEKEKADKDKKETETKDKKFNEAMQKSNELDKQGKYREAWVMLPKVENFPDHAETIRKRRTELSDKFSAQSEINFNDTHND